MATPPQSEPALDRDPPPAAVAYPQRIAALRAEEKAQQREHLQLGYVRLAFGIAIVILLFPPIPFVLLGVLGFALAARIHGRVLARLAVTRRALAFYERGLARLQDRWSELPPPEVRVDTSASLYAGDLDLFGAGSLFALLCEARTSVGEDTLARWLLQPAAVPAILERQAAVADLRTRLPLREAVAATRGPALAVLDPEQLAQWGEAAARPLPSVLRWIAPVLVALTLAAGWRYAVTRSPVLLVLLLLVDAALTFRLKRHFAALFAGAERAGRALQTAVGLLQQMEAQTFAAPRLQALQAQLQPAPGTGHSTASGALARLGSLSQWMDGRSNYVVRILDTPLLYSLQLALAVERWRARFGPRIRPWLAALGEFEALLSLAAFSYEHPEHAFPELVEGPPVLQARGLGHPLLPAAQCVRNDLSLRERERVLLVSGSNMSGKSTLLRSVGINAVLAQAGGPVCAHALRLAPLTVAASIQVNDSLQAGRSRFYAEILRLRSIVEAARTHPPVLFLLDELLAGTNSSDRVTGAEGLLRALLQAGALGLLSTHDLSLAALGGDAEQLIHNVHFEDTFANGELSFDYTLREGTVERSNGLALMRMIGLDV